MQRPIFPLAALALALAGCDAAEAPRPDDAAPLVPGATAEVVVDLVDGTPLTELLSRYPELEAAAARWNSPHSADEAIAVLRVPAARQGDLLARLGQDALVEHAEPNVRFDLPEDRWRTSDAARLIPDDQDLPALDGFPNDPLWGKQWNMELVGARGAWRYATGQGVIVAVIDTGVAYEDSKGLWAPDLKRTRFVAGYDFVNDDAIAADDHGHGTHCAGTIAQSTHNGVGVVGLARECQIMPLKVLSAEGWGTTSDIADAIRFAADNGAHVLSLSLGGGGYSRILRDAVRYAHAKGCVVVCAAGNGGRARIEYPAAYAEALAISAVGPTGRKAPYSSYGKGLFLAGPGGDMRNGVEDGVLQNTLDPRGPSAGRTVYAYFQGTSMATPHVAAAAALLVEAGVTRPDQVAGVLAASAQGSGYTQELGHGLLDAHAAVRRAVLLPGCVSLALAALALLVCVRRVRPRALPRPLLVLGAVMAASGLFFLRPLGVAHVPGVGPLLVTAIPDWGLVLFGPGWHWSPLFASALIPCVVGLALTPVRATRPLAVGLALGWAARLVTGVALPYADVRWLPGAGLLDALWLLANAGVCLAAAAYFVRLGRTKFAGHAL